MFLFIYLTRKPLKSDTFTMNTTYTFLAETEHNGVKTVNAASTTSETLAEVVQSFEYFLKGAGFYFHSLEVHATNPDVLNNEE